MRKTVQALLPVILMAALFAASFSVVLAEEAGTKEANKQEEVKKQKKAKKQKPGAKRRESGGGNAKTSDSSGIISDVNRTGRKVLGAARKGVETLKIDINEEYRKLKER